MPTWTALTLSTQLAAERIGAAMEALDPAPTGVGVMEIEDGRGLYEVAGYFTDPPDRAGLALLEAVHGCRAFVVSRVEDRDWVAQVRRELTPVEAGRFIVHGGHDAHLIPANRVGLRIEAAMAFGTGHHGTTRGCLLLIDGMARKGLRPCRVADIGCGTGVLAMAAARTWRVQCMAADIDPVAVATAAENIRANHLTPWVATACAPGFRAPVITGAGPFDLVLANILAAPLKRLAPQMARHMAPGGAAILSGLLRSQVRAVVGVYGGHGFTLADRVDLGDWSSLLLRRG